MDGPGGNLPRKRAGDSNSPFNPSPIKDWQKNTWFGPAPQDGSPFEEPDEAPELLELRSENVKQKSGDFWEKQKQPTGYQSVTHTSRFRKTGSQNRKKQKNGKLSAFVLKALTVALALTIIVAGVLFFLVYRVREIQVEGCSRITEEDIITLSGIRKGDSILTLKDTEVAEKLMSGARTWGKKNQNYYLIQFRYLERQLPGTVIITVKEREPCCWVDLRGIIYVLDKKRSVLWETEDEKDAPSNLVRVKGLKVKSGSQAGQTIVMESSVQQRIFEDLFLEMKVLGCTDMIKEVDLSKADREKDPSVLMETRQGYTVSLGDCRSSNPEVNRIHAKLRSMMLVQEELVRLGKYGGTIDVKTPESPYYAPTSEK